MNFGFRFQPVDKIRVAAAPSKAATVEAAMIENQTIRRIDEQQVGRLRSLAAKSLSKAIARL